MAELVMRKLLASRGMSVSGLDARALEGVPADALVDAALQCKDESDLRERLRGLKR